MSVDLDRARSYRQPSEQASRRAPVAWHAWPLGMLIGIGAAASTIDARSMRPDLHVTATDRLQIAQVLIGLLALGHVVLNLVTYFLDRERPRSRRLAELCSVGLTLSLLLLLFASPIPFGMFLPRP